MHNDSSWWKLLKIFKDPRRDLSTDDFFSKTWSNGGKLRVGMRFVSQQEPFELWTADHLARENAKLERNLWTFRAIKGTKVKENLCVGSFISLLSLVCEMSLSFLICHRRETKERSFPAAFAVVMYTFSSGCTLTHFFFFFVLSCLKVFHVCEMSGRQDSFLCPNGTIFSQKLFACDWW